jgi:hypothetical protein
MACYSPFGEAFVAMVEVEDINEAAVAAELERAVGENPAAFDGEKCTASPDGEGIPSEGAPG